MATVYNDHALLRIIKASFEMAKGRFATNKIRPQDIIHFSNSQIATTGFLNGWTPDRLINFLESMEKLCSLRIIEENGEKLITDNKPITTINNNAPTFEQMGRGM